MLCLDLRPLKPLPRTVALLKSWVESGKELTKRVKHIWTLPVFKCVTIRLACCFPSYHFCSVSISRHLCLSDTDLQMYVCTCLCLFQPCVQFSEWSFVSLQKVLQVANGYEDPLYFPIAYYFHYCRFWKISFQDMSARLQRLSRSTSNTTVRTPQSLSELVIVPGHHSGAVLHWLRRITGDAVSLFIFILPIINKWLPYHFAKIYPIILIFTIISLRLSQQPLFLL